MLNFPASISGHPVFPARHYARHFEPVMVTLVAVLGILVRTVNLSSLPMFNDEAIYLRWAADILDQKTFMSLFIPVAEDGKQPGFVWLSVAAMTVFSDPLIAGRVVSALAGTASLLGVWLAGRWMGGRNLGLLAAFLYAVTPFTVFFDRMALADSLVSTVAIWSLTLGIFIATKIGDGRAAMLAGVALGGSLAFGVWVKPTALFALPIPILCIALLSARYRPARLPILSLAVAYALFVAGASLLFVMPYAEMQLVLLGTHVYSPGELSSSPPLSVWGSWVRLYWSWLQAYLPAPLYWLALVGALWGLARRRRLAILLILSWLGIVVPSVAMAHFFTSRYVVNSVFPLLFLAALPLDAVLAQIYQRLISRTAVLPGPVFASTIAAALLAAVSLPSLLFDARLITDPSTVSWHESDRSQYVDGWPAGYGFNEALSLALSRARESDQETFILSDHIQGFPHDGIALYVRGMPKIRHYVEGEIAWGGRGVLEKWRSHNVNMLIIRDDGRNRPEQFEARIPEAKLLGVFWKPGGQSSFRVYELDLRSKG